MEEAKKRDKREREERMCRTREEILDGNLILSEYLGEIEDLEKRVRSGTTKNGDKMIDVLRGKSDIETKILTMQNSDDLFYLRRIVERMDRDSARFPSLLYQIVKIPKVGLPLFLVIGLFIWYIAGIPVDKVVLFLSNFGMKISDASQVRTGVLLVIAGVLFATAVNYGTYINKRLSRREGDVE